MTILHSSIVALQNSLLKNHLQYRGLGTTQMLRYAIDYRRNCIDQRDKMYSNFCQRKQNNTRFYNYTFRWKQNHDTVSNNLDLGPLLAQDGKDKNKEKTRTKKAQRYNRAYMFVLLGRAIHFFSMTCAKSFYPWAAYTI